LKILLITHARLEAEFGAAQIALRLGRALEDRGHDVTVWSPEPLPADTRWWNIWARQRARSEEFVLDHGPFDVVDSPAVSLTPKVLAQGNVVVRSVQPELRYLWLDTRQDLRHHPGPRSLLNAAIALRRARAIRAAWAGARALLCLGTHEAEWMQRHFSRWSAKTHVYVVGPSEAERAVLETARQARARLSDEPLRFLWIGRWASHKGPQALLDLIRRRRGATGRRESFTIAGSDSRAAADVPPEWIADGTVTVVPRFTRDELPALLATHHVGLFTSSVEGWGLSLNEMLEAGLTVYSTSAGGAQDLAPHFPHQLRPFPPPPRFDLAPGDDRASYLQRFSWPHIATEYESMLARTGFAVAREAAVDR
jgi:glycosyltransferase involved in cell wall biosynthesis